MWSDACANETIGSKITACMSDCNYLVILALYGVHLSLP